MSYLSPNPSILQRSGLLGVVIGLHVGVFLLVMAARTVAPQIMEMPLMVEFLEPPKIVEMPKPKPLPVSKPQPVKAQPAPKTPTPPIETTNSTQPVAAAAPVVQAESKPAPTAPAPAAEPVSQARFDADYLRNPAPAYPALSRRMGEEGKVVLRVSVNPQGTADSVEIKTSSGNSRLDEAAQKTVRNWKFVPAKRGDTPVQSWVLVPIIFKLEQ